MNAEGPTNLRNITIRISQQLRSLTDLLRRHPPSSSTQATTSPCSFQASRRPFPNQFPLKFRQSPKDMKDQLTTRRCGIHLFLQGTKACAASVQPTNNFNQMSLLQNCGVMGNY